MPSKKVYIILLVILLVFGLVMFLLFGVRNIREESFASTVIVGDNTTQIYNQNKWIYLRNRTSLEKLNWKEYHVFLDNKEKGDYLLWHNDKWYTFDKDKNAVNLDGKFIAYSANYKMKVLDFIEDDVDDNTYVKQVLQENGLSTSSQFSSIYKVSLDYDSDNQDEDFYIISNAFPIDFEPDVTFSIAFMVDNNTVYTLYSNIGDNMGFNGCKPFYHSFIDTNDDNVYEIILSCGQYSVEEQIDMLYQFINGEFKLLISNQ